VNPDSAVRYDRSVLVWTLVQHQRMGSRWCLCGWGDLGKSHAAHIADCYEASPCWPPQEEQ
jgi:hypothetical protein